MLLQNAQELGLEGMVQFADLIEEEDTTFGRTNQAFAIAVRASKRPTPMAKQFALCQAGTDRTAVEGDKRTMTALGI